MSIWQDRRSKSIVPNPAQMVPSWDGAYLTVLDISDWIGETKRKIGMSQTAEDFAKICTAYSNRFEYLKKSKNPILLSHISSSGQPMRRQRGKRESDPNEKFRITMEEVRQAESATELYSACKSYSNYYHRPKEGRRNSIQEAVTIPNLTQNLGVVPLGSSVQVGQRVPPRQDILQGIDSVIRNQINNFQQERTKTEGHRDYFAAIAGHNVWMIMFAAMAAFNKEILVYVQEHGLRIVASTPPMIAIGVINAPSAAFHEFSQTLPSQTTGVSESPQKFALNVAGVLKALARMDPSQMIKISASTDGYLTIEQRDLSCRLRMTEPKQCDQSTPSLSYAVRAVMPRNLILRALEDIEVVAKNVTLFVKNNSKIVISGIEYAGQVSRSIERDELTANSISGELHVTKGVETSFDLEIVKSIISAIRHDTICVELTDNGAMKISAAVADLDIAVHIAKKKLLKKKVLDDILKKKVLQDV